MSILKALSRQQKKAIGLLQVGTFLEYFDLMLYVHMAVFLNEIFFPKTDPRSAAFLSSFVFCSTFIFRPFGALIFGYIGDYMGRKTTVILTMTLMSTSCIVMANLPTYAQIGISASWAVTICRVMQGLSSMGEIMGAQVYLTEITKAPAQYVAVSLMSVAASLGAVVALGIATLVTTIGFNWRVAFWVGAGIAVIGSIARTRLRETPQFLEKLNARRIKIKENIDKSESEKNTSDVTAGGVKTIIGFFVIFCGWPLTFYLCYMYFNPILKQDFGYSLADIIFHNFFLALIQFLHFVFFSFMSYKINPLKIIKVKAVFLLLFVILLPSLISNSRCSNHIFMLQATLMVLSLSELPGVSIFIKYFPVLKRVTATSFLYSFSRAIMYIVTSFGLIYLTDVMGHYGLWVIMIPAISGFLWAVNHYAALEGIHVPKISALFGFKDKQIPSTAERTDEAIHIEDKKIA